MFGSTETTPGGKALKFYASQRLRVSRVSKSEVKEGNQVVGHSVKVKVVKNKLAPPQREAEFPILYSKGVDETSLLIDEAVETGVVTKEGKTYFFDGEKIAVGYSNYYNALSEDPVLLNSVVERVKESLKKT